jgi:hypothetical protein
MEVLQIIAMAVVGLMFMVRACATFEDVNNPHWGANVGCLMLEMACLTIALCRF